MGRALPGEPRVGRQAPLGTGPQGRGRPGRRPPPRRLLPAQYRRFLRRFGKKNENKAVFALAHTLVVIIWHLLAEGCEYDDLGGDHFDERNSAAARQRYLVRELEKLGNTVTLQPAA